MSNIAEELRERTALRYAGDCKCGQCQLVPRDLLDRAITALRVQAAYEVPAALRGAAGLGLVPGFTPDAYRAMIAGKWEG